MKIRSTARILLFFLASLSLAASALADLTILGELQTGQSFTQESLTLTPHASQATIPTDRHLFASITVENLTSESVDRSFRIRCMDTNQEIPAFPQPNSIYLAPGESQTVSFFLDELHGLLKEGNLDIGANTRTLTFEFTTPKTPDGFNFSIVYDIDFFQTNSPPSTETFTGTIVDKDNAAINHARVTIYTAGVQYQTQSDQQGSYSLEYPANDHTQFRLRIENAGYESHSQIIEQSDSGSTIQLQDLNISKAPQGTLSKAINGNVGLWRGIPSESAGTILFTNGMENWNGPNGDTYQDHYAESSLFLYSIETETFGDELWNYNLGQEAWGASLSQDGAYAAVVTTGPAGSRTMDPGTATVLDASDGSLVWDGNIGTLYGTSVKGDRLGSLCIQISNTSITRYLAMGTSTGDLLLIDLLTGNLVRRVFAEGQIREIRFDANDQYVYVGSGSGYLYKIEIATGTVVWEAYVYGWPFVNGLTFSPDGNWIGVGSKNFFASVVNLSTGTVAWSHRMGGTVHAVAFSPDSSMLVAGSGGLTSAYRVSDGEELWTVPRNGHKTNWLDDGSFVLIDETFYTPKGTAVSNLGIQVPGQSSQYSYLAGNGSIAVAAARDIAPNSDVLQFVTIALEDYVPSDDQQGGGPGGNPGGDPGPNPNPGGDPNTGQDAAFSANLIRIVGGNTQSYELRFENNRNGFYQIQTSENLTAWTPLGEPIQGDISNTQKWIEQISETVGDVLYFRVKLQEQAPVQE